MKRFITVLMSAMIALSMMPAMAFAAGTACEGGETCGHVAAIGETHYDTLVEAVAAVQSGGTIDLLKSCTGAGIATKKAEGTVKDFTIDFHGFTYTCTGPAVGSSGTESQAFHLEWNGAGMQNANVVLKNGTLTSTSGSGVYMLVQNYCNLSLDNMTLDGSNIGIGEYTLSNNCGNVSIKDTIIKAPTAGYAFDSCDYSIYTGVTVTVNGKSEIYGNVELTNPNGGDNNARIVVNGGTFSDINILPYLSDDADVTIELNKDVHIEKHLNINKGNNIVIDLNGHNIQSDTYFVLVVDGVNLHITGSGSIIENVEDGFAPLMVRGAAEDTENYSVVTIDKDVTLKGDYSGIFVDKGHANTYKNFGLVVNMNGTIDLSEIGSVHGNGIYINGSNIEKEGNIASFNLDGARIVGATTGIYAAGYAKWNIKNSTIESKNSAVEIRAGEMIIDDGLYSATEKPTETTPNGNGTTAVGSAIAISQHTTKLPIKVTFKKGTFSGFTGVLLANPENNSEINEVNVTVEGGKYSTIDEGTNSISKEENAEAATLLVSGGSFSSNPSAYVVKGTNIYHQKIGRYFVGSMPSSTSGYNAWALQNGVYEETYVAPAEPETPDAPVIDNSGSGADATTNVDASASTVVKDDKAETSINLTTGNKIVENAKENNVSEVVIKAETEKGEATGSTVALPESTVQALAAEDVQASVTIKTDNATVTLDKDAVKATAEQAGTDGEVKLVVETKEKNKNKVEIELKLVTSKGTVSDFKGGNVTVTVPVSEELASKKIVCVYIDENGKYTKMEGELSKDGKSYIFKTGHFSTYAILEETEADAIIAEQNKPSDIASAKVTGVVNKAYTGKSITQNPVVTVGESKLVKGADYTVSYKNNVNAGVATLTIKGAGSYTGTITKTFKINPKGTSISKVTGQKKAVKVVWKKQLTKMKTSYVSGYQVQYSTSSKFTSGTSKYANAKFSKGRTTKTIKNLKSGKKYYVRVRTYKSVDGTKCYSSWSKVKSVKTK